MPLTEKQKEQKRARAQARREQGLCANCNNKALPGESRCEDCLNTRRPTAINLAKSSDGTTHMKTVSLGELHPNPWQPRTTVDDDYIEELAADILSVGRLLQAPLTRPVDDGFQLAFGHSRVAALRLLHSRKEWPATVTVSVSELTDEEMAYIALSENRARKDLTALEELTAWSRALEIDGVTVQSLADKVGVHQSTMSKNLAILKLPDVVLEHISDGRLALRAARELLCLRNGTHSHDDMIEAVLEDCAGEPPHEFFAGQMPDYRTQTVRASIRGLTGGSSAYRHYNHRHANQDRNWRPLFEKGDGAGGRPISFDVDEFKEAFGDSVHILPKGKEDAKGLEWTCQVKEWSKWSARATREKSKAKEEQRPANSKNGTGAKPKPAPKPKGSKWIQALKKDPVVTALVPATMLRKLKADNDVESLPDEIREALGTRIIPVPDHYNGDNHWLPSPAHPEIKGLSDTYGEIPPMFDFSECANCTVGASWASAYYDGDIQLICTNDKDYMDKYSVGIERFLAWRDDVAARNREEDLKLGMELASLLSPGMAKIVLLSALDLFRDPRQHPESLFVSTWGEPRDWSQYNLPPTGAEQFAAVVGCDLPFQDFQSVKAWREAIEVFFADPPDDFDWPAAAAWLVMWKARLSAGFWGELEFMAMAMNENQEADGAESAVDDDYHERETVTAPSGRAISVLN